MFELYTGLTFSLSKIIIVDKIEFIVLGHIFLINILLYCI